MSSAYLIRAIAGGAAANIPLSQWFLLVMAFGSLFMVAGKRYAELQLAERTGAKIRKSLESYTSTYLRFVWTLSATAVVLCYGLWAFERDHGRAGWFAVSMIPFTIAILRYAVDVDGGVAGEPEEIALRDRVLQCCSWPGSEPSVSQSSSADAAVQVPRRSSRWPALKSAGTASFPYDITVRVSLWISVAVVAALFGWGAWQRRWIADDGLIVLRTVRNLLAGNGPVFNQGERVEANTSTVWTYLVYRRRAGSAAACSWNTWRWRWRWCSAWRACVLDAGHRPAVRARPAGPPRDLLPAGALVYIAVPPARDFATSGLENGLVLAYLGLLWWMMVCWSQAKRAPSRRRRRVFDGALAFVAGLQRAGAARAGADRRRWRW